VHELRVGRVDAGTEVSITCASDVAGAGIFVDWD
jgi:hypothetical protein